MTTTKICERPGCDEAVLRWLNPRYCSLRCQNQVPRLPLPKLAEIVTVPRAFLEEPSPVDLVDVLESQRRTPTAVDMIWAEGLVPEPEPVHIPDPPAEPAPPLSTPDGVAAWAERHLPDVQLTDWQRDLIAQALRHHGKTGRWPFFHLPLRRGRTTVRRVMTEIQTQREGNVR